MIYERCWHGPICCLKDMQGTNGVIAFGADRTQFVAAFFSVHSARSPFRRKGPAAEEGLELLGKLPQAFRPLADMALPWLMSDVNGVEMPLVSSAFWSGLPNERSTSCESWEEVVDNGAFLIENELLDEQAALAAWSKDMRLGDVEMALVAEVHRRRLATAPGKIVLSHLEADYLSRLSRDDQGYHACKKAFNGIGIVFPAT